MAARRMSLREAIDDQRGIEIKEGGENSQLTSIMVWRRETSLRASIRSSLRYKRFNRFFVRFPLVPLTMGNQSSNLLQWYESLSKKWIVKIDELCEEVVKMASDARQGRPKP
ncbi:hypothetical protein RHMOL_Rhmol04G0152600 [Rhododendron molle]|uniref:Uncharacterized protein n=1 Tax=Rhododendron molle TaxID=49168 RepID=A0ACC0P0L1_RHOML|nr:hypothetical protein RHMOL_Rhmol04G0152600 [Rhododendron molle]